MMKLIIFSFLALLLLNSSLSYSDVGNNVNPTPVAKYNIYASQFDLTDTLPTWTLSDLNSTTITDKPIKWFYYKNDSSHSNSDFSKVTESDLLKQKKLLTEFKGNRIDSTQGEKLYITYIGRKDLGNCSKNILSIESPTVIKSAFLLGISKLADSAAAFVTKQLPAKTYQATTKGILNAFDADQRKLINNAAYCFLTKEVTLKDSRNNVTVKITSGIDDKYSAVNSIALLLKNIFDEDTSAFKDDLKVYTDKINGTVKDTKVQKTVSTINSMLSTPPVDISLIKGLIDDLANSLANSPNAVDQLNNLESSLLAVNNSEAITDQIYKLRVTINDDSDKTAGNVVSKSFITGKSDHVFWSGDAILNQVTQKKFDSATNTESVHERSGLFYLGLNAMIGDMYANDNSLFKNVVFKGLISLSSKPDESWGIGIGYRFKEDFGFYDSTKTGGFMAFIGRFRQKGDGTDEHSYSTRFGISYDIGTALGAVTK